MNHSKFFENISLSDTSKSDDDQYGGALPPEHESSLQYNKYGNEDRSPEWGAYKNDVELYILYGRYNDIQVRYNPKIIVLYLKENISICKQKFTDNIPPEDTAREFINDYLERYGNEIGRARTPSDISQLDYIHDTLQPDQRTPVDAGIYKSQDDGRGIIDSEYMRIVFEISDDLYEYDLHDFIRFNQWWFLTKGFDTTPDDALSMFVGIIEYTGDIEHSRQYSDLLKLTNTRNAHHILYKYDARNNLINYIHDVILYILTNEKYIQETRNKIALDLIENRQVYSKQCAQQSVYLCSKYCIGYYFEKTLKNQLTQLDHANDNEARKLLISEIELTRKNHDTANSDIGEAQQLIQTDKLRKDKAVLAEQQAYVAQEYDTRPVDTPPDKYMSGVIELIKHTPLRQSSRDKLRTFIINNTWWFNYKQKQGITQKNAFNMFYEIVNNLRDIEDSTILSNLLKLINDGVDESMLYSDSDTMIKYIHNIVVYILINRYVDKTLFQRIAIDFMENKNTYLGEVDYSIGAQEGAKECIAIYKRKPPVGGPSDAPSDAPSDVSPHATRSDKGASSDYTVYEQHDTHDTPVYARVANEQQSHVAQPVYEEPVYEKPSDIINESVLDVIKHAEHAIKLNCRDVLQTMHLCENLMKSSVPTSQKVNVVKIKQHHTRATTNQIVYINYKNVNIPVIINHKLYTDTPNTARIIVTTRNNNEYETKYVNMTYVKDDTTIIITSRWKYEYNGIIDGKKVVIVVYNENVTNSYMYNGTEDIRLATHLHKLKHLTCDEQIFGTTAPMNLNTISPHIHINCINNHTYDSNEIPDQINIIDRQRNGIPVLYYNDFQSLLPITNRNDVTNDTFVNYAFCKISDMIRFGFVSHKYCIDACDKTSKLILSTKFTPIHIDTSSISIHSVAIKTYLTNIDTSGTDMEYRNEQYNLMQHFHINEHGLIYDNQSNIFTNFTILEILTIYSIDINKCMQNFIRFNEEHQIHTDMDANRMLSTLSMAFDNYRRLVMQNERQSNAFISPKYKTCTTTQAAIDAVYACDFPVSVFGMTIYTIMHSMGLIGCDELMRFDNKLFAIDTIPRFSHFSKWKISNINGFSYLVVCVYKVYNDNDTSECGKLVKALFDKYGKDSFMIKKFKSMVKKYCTEYTLSYINAIWELCKRYIMIYSTYKKSAVPCDTYKNVPYELINKELQNYCFNPDCPCVHSDDELIYYGIQNANHDVEQLKKYIDCTDRQLTLMIPIFNWLRRLKTFAYSKVIKHDVNNCKCPYCKHLCEVTLEIITNILTDSDKQDNDIIKGAFINLDGYPTDVIWKIREHMPDFEEGIHTHLKNVEYCVDHNFDSVYTGDSGTVDAGTVDAGTKHTNVNDIYAVANALTLYAKVHTVFSSCVTGIYDKTEYTAYMNNPETEYEFEENDSIIRHNNLFSNVTKHVRKLLVDNDLNYSIILNSIVDDDINGLIKDASFELPTYDMHSDIEMSGDIDDKNGYEHGHEDEDEEEEGSTDHVTQSDDFDRDLYVADHMQYDKRQHDHTPPPNPSAAPPIESDWLS